MNRRSLFKFLGIGAATAVIAPKVIVEAVKKPEYPGMSGEPISSEPFRPQKNLPLAKYIYIHLAHTSLPVKAGDIVFYKNDKKYGILAYKSKRSSLDKYGVSVVNITPGNYGFIRLQGEYTWTA